MNLIESSFDVTTAKRASAHPVFYPGYVVFIICGGGKRSQYIHRIFVHTHSFIYIQKTHNYTEAIHNWENIYDTYNTTVVYSLKQRFHFGTSHLAVTWSHHNWATLAPPILNFIKAMCYTLLQPGAFLQCGSVSIQAIYRRLCDAMFNTCFDWVWTEGGLWVIVR